MRSGFVLFVLLLFFATANAQTPTAKKPIDSTTKTPDTGYVNLGKIAGKKALKRSLVFPGLGQLYNYGLVVNDVKTGAVEGKKFWQKTYIITKIVAIYAGETALVLSYIDNRQKYKLFLDELQYRALHSNAPDPENGLAQYTNSSALVVAKNIYKRNSQVVLISIIGLYGANAVDAYITARLKYFNIDDTLSFKVSPSLINSNTMYGYQPFVPAFKLTIKL